MSNSRDSRPAGDHSHDGAKARRREDIYDHVVNRQTGAVCLGRARLQPGGHPLGRVRPRVGIGRRMWGALAALQRRGHPARAVGGDARRVLPSPHQRPRAAGGRGVAGLDLAGLPRRAPGTPWRGPLADLHPHRGGRRRGPGALRTGRRQRDDGARDVHGRAPGQHVSAGRGPDVDGLVALGRRRRRVRADALPSRWRGRRWPSGCCCPASAARWPRSATRSIRPRRTPRAWPRRCRPAHTSCCACARCIRSSPSRSACC